MIRKSGFTLIEILIATTIMVGVSLLFWWLFKYGIISSNRGQVSSQARENARMALERIQSELRQAVPLLTGCGGPKYDPPAIILPGPGGSLGIQESASVGCYMGGGIDCLANAPVLLPAGNSVRQNQNGPSGFLIFSELVQASGGQFGIYTPSDPAYVNNLANYVWVMYQVNAQAGNQPAQLVRYTFSAYSGGNTQGITGACGSWQRDNNFFVPAKSREAAQNIPAPVVVSLLTPQDWIWLMASHDPSTQDVLNTIGDQLDPQLFTVTSFVSQQAVQSANLPSLTATLSSRIRVEGAVQFTTTGF